MFSRPEGPPNMEIYIDQELIRRAEDAATSMVDSGDEQAKLDFDHGSANKPAFEVRTSKDQFTVLRTIAVGGRTFYLGVDTKNT